MAYGTLSVSDLLATQNATIAEVGEGDVFAAINTALTVWNRTMQEKLGALVEFTTDRIRSFGGPDSMQLQQLDEFGTPNPQKVTAGVNLGFPLRRYGGAVQWTRHYFQNRTPAELAANYTALETADARAIDLEIRRALFVPTNYTFIDVLTNRYSLDVKALLNADGAAIPMDPNGGTYDGATHTHYLATASFVVANLQSLIDTVLEHHPGGGVMVYINRAQEAAIRAFTGFYPYYDSRVDVGANAARARGNLDMGQPTNRAIGVFDAAEIWVKPWIPAGYLFAWNPTAPKPLAYRRRNNGSGNFALEYDDESHPLRAQVLAREFGVGVWTRTNGAVLYTGGGTYAAPSLN